MYFFSALNPRNTKFIYWVTAVGFIFWKLPISQPFIDFWNSIGIEIYRTVDYSDLLTLLVLPLSFSYSNSRIHKDVNQRKPAITLLALVSLFSFFATTLPRQGVNIQADTNKSFLLEFSKEELFNRMSPGYVYNDTIPNNLNDSLFYLSFDIPELKADVTVLSNIQEFGSGKVIIKLDSVVNCYVTGGLIGGIDQESIDKVKKLKPRNFENYFEKYFVERIKSGSKGNNLYYVNKEFDDSYGREE